MQSAVLSFDIWLEIIDSLAADLPTADFIPFDFVGLVDRPNVQRPALRALALTCSAWLPRARAHLYRSVALYDARAMELFFRTLAANPRLGALVRSLQLRVRWVDAFGPPSVTLGAHALTRLEELEVAMADAEQGEGPFQFIGALAVARPLPRLTLYRAFFATLEQFATLTAKFESVRTLTLSKCSSDEDTVQPDAIDPGLCKNVVHLQVSTGRARRASRSRCVFAL
ncbi:hypothetical protein BD413DRAFT_550896 [Trametes elegans]|nr:hypothetical protein BD413DRAFT_550896 [Trametes elegans]